MAKPVKSIPAASEGAAKPKSKKLMVISIAVLGLLIVVGMAGWYFTKGSSHPESAKQQEMIPRFIKLDTFTVNLRHGEGEEERVLQTLINLEVRDAELEEKIKLLMPKIYNNILILLSKKRPSELSTAEGKQQLAREIKIEVDAVLGLRPAPVSSLAKPAAQEGNATPGTGDAAQAAQAAPAVSAPMASNSGIVDVLFTSFIIQ